MNGSLVTGMWPRCLPECVRRREGERMGPVKEVKGDFFFCLISVPFFFFVLILYFNSVLWIVVENEPLNLQLTHKLNDDKRK